MKILRLLLVAIALFTFCAQGFTAGDNYVPAGASQHLNIAQMGMGGLTTMIGTNSHTTFYNPALLNRQGLTLEIAPLVAGVSGSTINVMNFIIDNKDHFTDIDKIANSENPDSIAIANKFFSDSESFNNRWVGTKISPFFGMTIKGMGFGFYGNTAVDVKVDQGAIVPTIGARAYLDLVFGFGYGRIVEINYEDWEFGAAMRIINRRTTPIYRLSADEAEEFADIISEDFKESTFGFGLDVGTIRTFEVYNRPLDVGVVIQDMVGVLDGWVKPDLKVGALYHFPFEDNIWVPLVNVGVEYVDIFNRSGVSYAQKINFGTEANFFAKWVKLRLGLHQGYPTFGFGADLVAVKLDYAYFTRELGTAPGMIPEATHQIGITFGIW